MPDHLDISRLLDIERLYVLPEAISAEGYLSAFFGTLDGRLLKFTLALADAGDITFLDIWAEEQPQDMLAYLSSNGIHSGDSALDAQMTEILVRLHKPWPGKNGAVVKGLEGARFVFTSDRVLTMASHIDRYGKPNLRCSLEPDGERGRARDGGAQ